MEERRAQIEREDEMAEMHVERSERGHGELERAVPAITNEEELHAASYALGEALAGLVWPWHAGGMRVVSTAAEIAIKISLFHLPSTAWADGAADFERRVMDGIEAGYDAVFAERGEQVEYP